MSFRHEEASAERPAEFHWQEQMQLFDLRNAPLCLKTAMRPRTSTVPIPSRSLKIEAEGDFWAKKISPKIRLKGKWLEHAGFAPGNRVSVTCVAPGVIELRLNVSQAPETESVP